MEYKENATKENRMSGEIIATARFIFRLIFRSKEKTILMVVVMLVSVLALGYLQETILRGEANLEELYENTAVVAEIQQLGFGAALHRLAGNIIRPRTIQEIIDSGYIRNEYALAAHEYAVNVPMVDGGFPENWEEITGISLDVYVKENLDNFNPIIGTNDLSFFIKDNSRDFLDELAGGWRTLPDGTPLGDMEIDLAPGFDESNFMFSEDSPVPVILSPSIMDEQGLDYGDLLYVGTTYYDSRQWSHIKAEVVGSHNRNITGVEEHLLDATLMPAAGLEYLLGDHLGYVNFRFEIDPAYSRDISRVSAYLIEIVTRPEAGWMPLNLLVWDEELNMVVEPLERNISLLRLLYPVAIAICTAIGVGLSLLLMLQNAINAAVMRVLGSSRRRTRITLVLRQLIISFFGLFLGFFILLFAGWGFGVLSALELMGIYFVGVTAGSIIGAVLVTNREVLELLQVKE
jgi:hypothetical protein